MKRTVTALLSVLWLGGCGVLIPYMYDAQTLDQLIVSMPKEQVLKQLGKPNRVVLDEGRQIILEYRLYPQGDWTAYLIHCPFFPNCYFPGEAGHPHYVVLQDNQLCLWGTPDVVRPLLGLVCGPTTVPLDRKEHVHGDLRISVIPVFMPPPIVPLPQRLAVIPVDGSSDFEISSWLDLTLNFLRTRHRDLVLVEREDLKAVLNEMGIQYGGHVDDETSIHIGRLVGADSLLTYRMIVPEDMPLSAAFELRLFKVESGTTLFRQTVSASQVSPVPGGTRAQRSAKLDSLARRPLLQEAAVYGLAAFTAAFGDNPLGLVPDHGWSGEGVKVLDVLQGGPGFHAGLKPGDQIMESDDRPVGSWSDPVRLPAQLTVRHNGVPLRMFVR